MKEKTRFLSTLIKDMKTEYDLNHIHQMDDTHKVIRPQTTTNFLGYPQTSGGYTYQKVKPIADEIYGFIINKSEFQDRFNLENSLKKYIVTKAVKKNIPIKEENKSTYLRFDDKNYLLTITSGKDIFDDITVYLFELNIDKLLIE